MTEQPLLVAVETFLTRSGMAASAFGRGAVNDWKLVNQLRDGRRLWPETENRVRAFMRDYSGAEQVAA